MDFGYSEKVEARRTRVREFMGAHIVLRIRPYREEIERGVPAINMHDLKAPPTNMPLCSAFREWPNDRGRRDSSSPPTALSGRCRSASRAPAAVHRSVGHSAQRVPT